MRESPATVEVVVDSLIVIRPPATSANDATEVEFPQCKIRTVLESQ